MSPRGRGCIDASAQIPPGRSRARPRRVVWRLVWVACASGCACCRAGVGRVLRQATSPHAARAARPVEAVGQATGVAACPRTGSVRAICRPLAPPHVSRRVARWGSAGAAEWQLLGAAAQHSRSRSIREKCCAAQRATWCWESSGRMERPRTLVLSTASTTGPSRLSTCVDVSILRRRVRANPAEGSTEASTRPRLP